MKITAHSLEETQDFARTFLTTLSLQKNRATIVGLYGDLGSGKTTFSKALAEEVGIIDTVSSPTFVIMKMYTIPKLHTIQFDNLIHIDAYRLAHEDELLHLGWREIIKDSKNLILIEWPEKVEKIIPKDHIRLHFTFINENTRTIENNISQ